MPGGFRFRHISTDMPDVTIRMKFLGPGLYTAILHPPHTIAHAETIPGVNILDKHSDKYSLEAHIVCGDGRNALVFFGDFNGSMRVAGNIEGGMKVLHADVARDSGRMKLYKDWGLHLKEDGGLIVQVVKESKSYRWRTDDGIVGDEVVLMLPAFGRATVQAQVPEVPLE